MSRTLVAATGNPGKLAELERLLAGIGWEVVPQSALGVESPPEDGLTFVENAIIKARHASERTGRPALADDSGIVVDALGGAPGVRSARYAGEGSDDAANNEKLVRELAGVPPAERTARFECAVVWMRNSYDPVPLIARGTWAGAGAGCPAGYERLRLRPPLSRPGRAVLPPPSCPPSARTRSATRGQALRALRAALASTTA